MAKKILIVEDDIMLIKIMEARLHNAGYETIVAQDGQAGLKMARSENPDLIIMDVMLPKMDGFRATQMLKFDDRYKHIPIVMFTGRMQEEDRETGLSAGANAYICKTSEPSSLIDKINDLIGV
jgi:DNA-binding response OmpR family regulator